MADSKIHPTAIIDPQAELDSSVEVGPYAVIEGNVQIAEGCKIGPRALIASGTRMDKNVIVHHCATIGTMPQDLKFGGEDTVLKIGENTILREYTTLNRGTTWSGESVIGKNCFMMAYSHLAHDCHLGDNIIMANSVQLGGHSFIGDWSIIGGGSVVLQFTKIGKHAMIGGGLRIVQDICPYALIGGYPLKISGVNLIGLKRRGFTSKDVKPIKDAFKFLFYSGMNTSQAVERIKAEVEQTEDVKHILEFLTDLKHGLLK